MESPEPDLYNSGVFIQLVNIIWTKEKPEL